MICLFVVVTVKIYCEAHFLESKKQLSTTDGGGSRFNMSIVRLHC